jgi:CRISPR/Cas system CMR subunit Cmr4 (Cas7 group RAMP superfamily)
MIDRNIININKINFKKKFSNYYIKHDDNDIKFYIRNTINIFPITNRDNKYNLTIKLDDETKKIIEDIETKFIEQNNINEDDYIPIIKTNDKGSILKLKIMNRYNKLVLKCMDRFKQGILYSDIEKYTKMDCKIHICNFWNYKGKYGLLVYVNGINLIGK